MRVKQALIALCIGKEVLLNHVTVCVQHAFFPVFYSKQEYVACVLGPNAVLSCQDTRFLNFLPEALLNCHSYPSKLDFFLVSDSAQDYILPLTILHDPSPQDFLKAWGARLYHEGEEPNDYKCSVMAGVEASHQ